MPIQPGVVVDLCACGMLFVFRRSTTVIGLDSLADVP